MRTRWLWSLLLIVTCWIGPGATGKAAQAAPDQYAGMWTGTYDGSGAGQFEMTLAKGNDNTMSGKVNVSGDGATYSADLKSIAFEGQKMTAKYDFPPDPSAEIVMLVTFDGAKAKGTWSLRAKGQTDEIAAGGLDVTKK